MSRGSELSSLPPIVETNTRMVVAVIEEGLRARRAVTERLGDFLNLYFLVGKNKFTVGLIPENILEKCRLAYESWQDLFKQKISQEYGEGKRDFDPAHFLSELFDSDYEAAGQIMDEASKKQFLDPSAPRLLQLQLEATEAVLGYFAPQFSDCRPEDPTLDAFLAVDDVTHPRTLPEALEFVRVIYRATVQTKMAYVEKDRYTATGGFGELYILLKQESFFSDLLPPELIKKGLKLKLEREGLRADYLRRALLAKGYDFPHDKDVSFYRDAIKGWFPEAQDALVRSASEMEYREDKFADYFTRQQSYEEILIDYLIARQTGLVNYEIASKDDLRKLVEQSHEFTRMNMDTFARQDAVGFTGGYKSFYQFLQSEAACQYLEPDLVARGIKINRNWENIKNDAFSEAVKMTWGIDLKGAGLQRFLTNLEARPVEGHFIPKLERLMRRRARRLILADPRSLSHFQRQMKYEEEVLRVL